MLRSLAILMISCRIGAFREKIVALDVDVGRPLELLLDHLARVARVAQVGGDQCLLSRRTREPEDDARGMARRGTRASTTLTQDPYVSGARSRPLPWLRPTALVPARGAALACSISLRRASTENSALANARDFEDRCAC